MTKPVFEGFKLDSQFTQFTTVSLVLLQGTFFTLTILTYMKRLTGPPLKGEFGFFFKALIHNQCFTHTGAPVASTKL